MCRVDGGREGAPHNSNQPEKEGEGGRLCV